MGKMGKAIKKKSTTVKKAAKKIIASSLPHIIGENFPNGSISLIDKELKFIFTNGSGYKAFGLDPRKYVGKSISTALNATVFKQIQKALPKIFAGKSITQEIKMDDYYFLNSYKPIVNKNGKIDAFVLVAQNITDLKKTTQENDKLQYIIKRSLNEIYIFHADTLLFEFVNDGALKNLGYSQQAIKKLTPIDLKPEFTLKSFEKLITPLRKGKEEKIEFETYHRRANGTHYPVEVHLQLVNAGNEKKFVAIILDISQRKTDQIFIKEKNEELATIIEELQASSEELQEQNDQLALLVKEKEDLFKELHHRIKNNLQMVISLLFLKGNQTQETSLQLFIKETRNRIFSIALLHEQLLQMKGIDKLDIAKYLQKLVKNLIDSYSSNNQQFEVKLDLDSYMLSTEQAVNVGLITNEILSNIIKYAYPAGQGGPIYIAFKQSKEVLTLKIADVGKGIPDEIIKNHRKSYGIQLIELFTNQLKGKLILSNNNGTAYEINFKDNG
jgi:PAS domain S-box-containing protein